MGQATSVENRRAASPAIVCATKHVSIEWTIGDTKYTGALDLSTPETTASTGTHLLGKIRGSYGDNPPAKLGRIGAGANNAHRCLQSQQIRVVRGRLRRMCRHEA